MSDRLGSSTYSSKDKTSDMVRILSKQKTGLNVCHINAQSLNNKMDEFSLIFENSGIDVLCVSETWFDPLVPNTIFDLQNYKLHRCDRVTHAGGVAIYVKNGISSKIFKKSEQNEKIEYIFIEIASRGNKILVGCVYRPNRSIATENFFKTLEEFSCMFEDVVICGDFNSNLLVENFLIKDMETIGVYPTNIAIPTHFTASNNSLLDIVFVSDKEKVLLYDQITASCFSKHDLLFLSYDFQIQDTVNVATYYDFKHMNTNIILHDLANTEWDSIYHMLSAECQLDFLEKNIEQIFNKSVPVKSVTNTFKRKPWFNRDIKAAIDQRDLVFGRWKRFKSNVLHVEYCNARREVNRKIKKAKCEYYSSVFNSAANIKKTWKNIRDIGIGKQRSVDTTEIDVETMNETFLRLPEVSLNRNIDNSPTNVQSQLFTFNCVTQDEVLKCCLDVKSNAMGFDNIHPKFLKTILPVMLPYITFIFNTILTKSIFPDNWKHAKVIPIPKANNNNEYRPISILPFLSKVFEKLLHKQIYEHINNNNLLTSRQSGFRPKHSCVTALIDVSEEIRKNIDAGFITFLVLLDHSKAFDMVDHQILCSKLISVFNFSSSSTRLINSYLSDRRQSVVANNKTSRPLAVTKGVPQGSILGPLLFTIYVNDLPLQLKHCNVHIYADDVQVFISTHIKSINDCLIKLNDDLGHVYTWATSNGLCLNPIKSKCLMIYSKSIKLSIKPEVVLNNQLIEIVQTTKNLGIIFNNNLTWSDHINTAVGKTYGMLRVLWKTQYFTPVGIRLLLAKTYILPILLYGCEIFSSCDRLSYNKLEKAYNAILRYVFGLKKYDHITPFSKKIYGITFSDLLKIRTLTLLHKIINTREPLYLYNRILFTRSLRSNDLIQFRHRTLTSEWQFFINSIRLWNLLPSNIQFISNAMHFKKALLNFYN